MNKYDNKIVNDYINGNDIDDFNIDDLENDSMFMKKVIVASNDKNFYRLCSDRVKKDYNFIKFVIYKFKEDIEFISKVADEFLDCNDDLLFRNELLIIMCDLINKDSEYYIKYDIFLDASYQRERLSIELVKADLEDEFVINEIGFGFLVILNSFRESGIVCNYYAKRFITDIFSEYDIDLEVMDIYKNKIGATEIPNEQVLKARGFLVEDNGKLCFTKAGMLLFGKNPSVYLPSARVRVLKFEGINFQVGTEMNIVKDRTFDKCLYKTLEETRDFINSQLREFTHLNQQGIFETVPEYPEFAWYEGLVNAVTHRDYSNTGEYITVKLFDDRLEILSPGKLSGFITLDNMKTERYSRNPQIARVLTEFGIVRELNEGVKRIYSEMQRFYLKDPIYSEPNQHAVLLVLDNNIVMRSKRKNETMLKNSEIEQKWVQLNYQERQVLQAIYDKGEITSVEVAEIIKRGKTTAVKLLNRLVDYDLIVWTGTTKYDKFGRYILK